MEKKLNTDSARPSTECPTGVSTGRVSPDARPARELDRLRVFIGRWITEGETVAQGDVPGASIVASDVYQWVPGGHFIVHPAYGRIGSISVGGVEIIGHDASTKQFQTYFASSAAKGTWRRRRCRIATACGHGKERMHAARVHSVTMAKR